MNLNPWMVVAGWAAGIGGMATILAGFGGSLVEYPEYEASAVLMLLVAGAVGYTLWRRAKPTWRQPPPGDSVLFIVLAIVLAAVGWAFSWYLMPAAILPLMLAVRREVRARRMQHAPLVTGKRSLK